MRSILALLLAGSIAAFAGLSSANAADEHGAPQPPRNKWSFSGPLGKFDRAQLQRGFKVYKEVCSVCHGLDLVPFRTLTALGYSEAQVKQIASEYKIKDGPNDAGEMFEREGRPADRFPRPWANENAARAQSGGTAPY
jgi:ubiquinol-cytochrome c reductase cytochrome b/c1 subunit